MHIKKVSLVYLLLILIFSSCDKKNDEPISPKNKAAEITQKSDTKVAEEKTSEIVQSNNKKDELQPTNEGFKYGEWRNLNIAEVYFPDYSGNGFGKIVLLQKWMLKKESDFDKDSPDSVKVFDAEGNLIKSISYVRDVSGNIYKYDDSNRLISITPNIGNVIQENKKITLRYFKDKDGNIIRKSYQNDKLVLEELERKISNGWEYSWKESDQDNPERIILKFTNGIMTEYTRYYASGGSTRFTFEYDKSFLIKVSTIDGDDRQPYRINEYSFRKDGLLKKVEIYDPRKTSKVSIRSSVFSNYDDYGNWRKEEIRYSDGDPEIIIRRFQYLTQ